jgi:phage terminase large subunit-like protein
LGIFYPELARPSAIMLELVNNGSEPAELVSLRAGSAYRGVVKPRIHTKLTENPSKGLEFVEFCAKYGQELLPWQEWLSEQTLRLKPDGRWQTPVNGILIARQNGKSTWMAWQILWRIFGLEQKLQVHTAHKLTTSAEVFYKIYNIITEHPELESQLVKKLEARGFQELQFSGGRRYIVRASNSATRGIAAPDTIWLDEAREYHDEDVWSSLRFTQMASANPQAFLLSNAGDQHSIVLNKMRERALASILTEDLSLGWWEWSAPPEIKFDGSSTFWEGVAQANPSLGHTIHPDNIRAVLNDPEDIVRTEVLCQWVSTINPVIHPSQWQSCAVEGLRLDPAADTWLALDLSPDRRQAALVASQRIDRDKFQVQLLQTWTNPGYLSDKLIANDIGDWYRKFNVLKIAYSARTASAVAARLVPAGLPVEAIDGQPYATSCDEFLSAISSGRLAHSNQEELTAHCLSAVRLNFGDGGWVMGRKVSNTTITGAVAAAMASHYATQSNDGIDIIVA